MGSEGLVKGGYFIMGRKLFWILYAYSSMIIRISVLGVSRSLISIKTLSSVTLEPDLRFAFVYLPASLYSMTVFLSSFYCCLEV